MEEFWLLIFALLAIVAWGLGLIGVPILFKRMRKLEHQVQVHVSDLNRLLQQGGIEQRITPSSVPQQPETLDELNESVIGPEEFVTEQTIVVEESTAQQVLDTETPPPQTEQHTNHDNDDEPYQTSWIERQLSTNLTAKIGAVVLIFGAVFLAKYASDIGMFTITARLWSMGIVAIIMTAIGHRLVASKQRYADVLQGTGFAVWLSTWFAAHVLYNQVGWMMTLIACVIAVMFMGYRALKQNSQVLAFIGLLGGFIAPFIASSEANSLWRLFSYMLLMNIAVAVISINKPWRWFLRLGYIGSFLLLSLLMTAEYFQGDLDLLDVQLPMLVFTLGLMVIYSLLAVKWLSNNDESYHRVLSGLLISVPSLAALAVYGLFKQEALITAAVLALAALWYAALWFKSRQWSMLATSIIAATMAIPFALNDSLSSLIYSIEGAAFFVFAVRQQRWVYIAWASIIQISAVAFALYLFTDAQVRNESLYLAWPLFGAVIIAGIVSAWTVFKAGGFDRYNNLMQKALIGWSLFWWLYLWAFYCAEVLSLQHTLFAGIALIPATILLLELVNIKYKWPNLLYFQSIFTGTLFLCSLVYFAEYDAVALWWEKILIVGLIAAYFILRIFFNRRRPDFWMVESILLWFGFTAITGLMLFNLTSIYSDWSIVRFLLPLVIMLQLRNRLLPILFQREAERAWVIPVTFIAILSCSLVTVTAIGNYASWPYIAIVHPMSLLLMVIGYALFSIRHQQPLFIIPGVTWTALMVTLEANRFLFHYFGVAFHFDAWLSSAITQMVWSLMWSMIGATLMVLGSRFYVSKRVWISGALALGIVVIKLFVLDLSNVDTLYRILSFIGVGALLLVVGYFAPLPQSDEQKSEQSIP